MEIKMTDLCAIRKRLSQTTKGQWKIKNSEPNQDSRNTDWASIVTDGEEVLSSTEWLNVGFDDLEFLANAKSDIEFLLSEIDRLQQEKGA
jgi:hypothetical protein